VQKNTSFLVPFGTFQVKMDKIRNFFWSGCTKKENGIISKAEMGPDLTGHIFDPQ